ncbi:MAG: hypothetical protein ACE5PT_03500 [Gemmatimonadales bacterium]
MKKVRTSDLTGALVALESNIAAIRGRDTEAYLAHYLNSSDLIVVGGDSLRRGYFMFSEARRASDEWPDTLIVGEPHLVWISPGVVWGGFEYLAVMSGDTTRGFSERLFVKTGGGWKIAVTGSAERCDCP